MSQGPPKAIEAVVALLIPPARREEVLGDLQERYQGTAQYVIDALGTVPHVVASQIRRTTDPRIVIFEALALYISFVTAPAPPHGRPLIFEPGLQPSLHFAAGPLLIAVPVVIALVVLRFVDAYSRPEKRTQRVSALELLLAVAIAYAAEELLRMSHPALALPRGVLLQGGVLAAFLIWVLRRTIASRGEAARPATPRSSGRALGPQDFQRGIERLQAVVRNRKRVGSATSLFLIVAFAVIYVFNTSEVARIGAVLVVIGAAYIGLQILIVSIRTGRLDTREIEPARYESVYRAALVRQRDYHRGGWFWTRLVLFAPGGLLVWAGMAESQPSTRATVIGVGMVMVLLAFTAIPLNSKAARQYQREIDRVDAANKERGGNPR